MKYSCSCWLARWNERQTIHVICIEFCSVAVRNLWFPVVLQEYRVQHQPARPLRVHRAGEWMHVMTSCGMTTINKTGGGGSMAVHTAHSHATLHMCQGDLNTVRAMTFGRTSSHHRERSSDFPLSGVPLVCFDDLFFYLLYFKSV
jgi:hypothetical protein